MPGPGNVFGSIFGAAALAALLLLLLLVDAAVVPVAISLDVIVVGCCQSSLMLGLSVFFPQQR